MPIFQYGGIIAPQSCRARAVVNGEQSLLVLAGAGSGKTSVLVARAGWLLTTGEAVADQILLLAFGRKAAQEMDERIQARLHTGYLGAHVPLPRFTHHSTGQQKVPVVSKLENDAQARRRCLSRHGVSSAVKKAQAKGWRQWLEEELNWEVPEGSFWQDEKLARRLGSRLDRWVSLMRMHGGSQTEMIESAPESIRAVFSKRVKLMAPMLKAWKTALKDENAVDFSGLIHQAIIILEKGRFVSPWKHILVDEFQDISPQRAALRCGRRINTRRCLPWAMTGRLSTVSAGRNYPHDSLPPLFWGRRSQRSGHHLPLQRADWRNSQPFYSAEPASAVETA